MSNATLLREADKQQEALDALKAGRAYIDDGTPQAFPLYAAIEDDLKLSHLLRALLTLCSDSCTAQKKAEVTKQMADVIGKYVADEMSARESDLAWEHERV